jgi:hypothetical protein
MERLLHGTAENCLQNLLSESSKESDCFDCFVDLSMMKREYRGKVSPVPPCKCIGDCAI